jgi:hypothetical protein
MTRDKLGKFRAEMKRRREEKEWSPEHAALQAGISSRSWRTTEAGTPSTPGGPPPLTRRKSIIAIANGLRWPVNEALKLAGEAPSSDERQPRSPAGVLERWNKLTSSQRDALLTLMDSMIDPHVTVDDVHQQPAPARQALFAAPQTGTAAAPPLDTVTSGRTKRRRT